MESEKKPTPISFRPKEHELEQIRLNQKKLEGMKKLIIQENERRKEEALKAKAKRKRQ